MLQREYFRRRGAPEWLHTKTTAKTQKKNVLFPVIVSGRETGVRCREALAAASHPFVV